MFARKLNRLLGNNFFCVPEPASTDHRIKCTYTLRSDSLSQVFLSKLQDTGNENQSLSLSFPPVSLYKISNCYLAGPQGYIFLDAIRYLSLGSSLQGVNARKMMRPVPMFAHHETVPLFYLGENSVSRAHAVMEHLSRYQIAREYLPRGTQVVVQNGQSSWWSPYLKAAGAEGDPLETKHGTLYSKELYFVPMPTGPGINLIGEPHHYLELKKNALRDIRSERSAIFLSRCDAPRRRLLNEDRIFEISKKYIPDIKRTCLSFLTFKEQLEIVAGAPVIIHPHGQGSHLSLFSEKTLSIQLVPGQATLENSYFKCALLFDYFCSIGGTNLTRSCASGIVLANNEDWYYPEEKFENELRSSLKVGI